MANETVASMGKDFDYELGAKVKLLASDETGVVIGRAQYTDGANGRQVKDWWTAADLDAQWAEDQE